MLLHLPVSIPGIGDFSSSWLLHLRDGEWVAIDAWSWENELHARLPKDVAVWNGIWPDYRAMRARASLYRANDDGCCPTGGSVDVQLALEDGRLVMTSFRVLRPRR